MYSYSVILAQLRGVHTAGFPAWQLQSHNVSELEAIKVQCVVIAVRASTQNHVMHDTKHVIFRKHFPFWDLAIYSTIRECFLSDLLFKRLSLARYNALGCSEVANEWMLQISTRATL